MPRRTLVCLSVAIALAALPTAPAPSASIAVAESHAVTRDKPNLLFILTDDQRVDMMEVMPAVKRNFPVEFSQAVATTPLCCPSRSSFLTGRFARHTGVRTNQSYDNFKRFESESLAPWLRALGYRTGFVGKYFNHFGVNDGVPPGWNEFHAMVWNADGTYIGNGYSDFALREKWNQDGQIRNEVIRYPNAEYPDAYTTTVFGSLAEQFIRRAEEASSTRPWALFLWPNAPHIHPEPRYQKAPVPEWDLPPSYKEPDMSDKPEEVRSHARQASDPLKFRIRDFRALMSVDDVVGRLGRTLDELGLRSETRGIFASDNGKLWGEHWLTTKQFGYEESARIPLRMMVPGAVRPSVDELVANIDVAPTLMKLAGDSSSHDFDGRSFLRLAHTADVNWRTAIMLESWGSAQVPLRYDGVRTGRWKFIHWIKSGNTELYDLRGDPYELRNVAKTRPRTVRRMKDLLARLRAG